MADIDVPHLRPSRWAFWTNKALRSFCYATAKSESQSRGYHIAVESYNPLTDRVRFREGHFGYVENEGSMSRAEYWEERTKFHPDDRRG